MVPARSRVGGGRRRPPAPRQAEGTRAPVARSLLMAGLGGIAAVWALASLVR